ncbi:MAG: hypothetical protein K0R92_454 [Lachnospiraceae bacterium]|nr:hypothetical protein [Lachnospiraceae bacterium]
MFIKSQDGKRLLNLDNTTLIEVVNNNTYSSIAFFSEGGKWHHYMGNYLNEDDAIRVIDMICEAIKGDKQDIYGSPISLPIFQMPRE